MYRTEVLMARRIYFAGSIRAGREDADLYGRIIRLLQRYGTVLTEHVGDCNLEKTGKSSSRAQSVRMHSL